MDGTLLRSLGLTEQEARLFKAVRKDKEVTPTELAKTLGMKRTTAYSAARGLVEKGFLLEDKTRRPCVFSIATPEDIQGLVTSEQKRFADRQSLLKQLAGEIERIEAKDAYPVPRIRFIEEAKIKNFLYQEIPLWYKSLLATEPTFWGFQDHTFLDHYQEWIDWQWKTAPKDVSLRFLTNHSETERKISGKYPRRHVKFWGEALNFLSSTWVAGEYVVMINTRARPFYLVEIHDKLMAHDQREVFRNLWPLVP